MSAGLWLMFLFLEEDSSFSTDEVDLVVQIDVSCLGNAVKLFGPGKSMGLLDVSLKKREAQSPRSLEELGRG